MGVLHSKSSKRVAVDDDARSFSSSVCERRMNIAIGRCDRERETYWRVRYVVALCGEWRSHDPYSFLHAVDERGISEETASHLKRLVDEASARRWFSVTGRAYTLLAAYYFIKGDVAAAMRYGDLAVQLGKRTKCAHRKFFVEHREGIADAAKDVADRCPPSHDCYGRPFAKVRSMVNL